MPESAYSISESPKTLSGDSGLSNPVELWEPTGCARQILPHLALLESTPTKYRRPSEGRRDSFGGGVWLITETVLHRALASLRVYWGFRAPNAGITSKTISRRYPLAGDCNSELNPKVRATGVEDLPTGITSRRAKRHRWQALGALGSCGVATCTPVSRIDCLYFTRAVPIGRCFSQFDRNSGCYRNGQSRDICAALKGAKQCYQPGESPGTLPVAAWGTQTRHGGSVVKYQPCSQEESCFIERTDDLTFTNAQSVRNMRFVDIVVIYFSSISFVLIVGMRLASSRYQSTDGTTNRSNWQKPGIGRPLSVKSSPFKGYDEEEVNQYPVVNTDEGRAVAMGEMR